MTLPPLRRAAQDRSLFGVCAGIADGFDVDVSFVRAAFAALALLGGIGLFVYAILVLLLPSGPPPVPAWHERPRPVLAAVAVLALTVIGTVIGLISIPLSVLVPVALLSVGVALVWREVIGGREDERPERRELVRLAGGLALLGGGALSILLDGGKLAQLSSALIAGAVVAAGMGLLVGPRLQQAQAEVEAERRERVRADERADVAARLHDSVLQTLALIQRENDPRRAQSLARGQERELRGWLYGGAAPDGPDTLGAALHDAAVELEEHYGVAVDLVQPSDGALDDGLAALAAAAREALSNAGKHAGVDRVSVLARVGDREASVFVRDRGRGFAPAEVAADRRGVRESIVGRMERFGGSAVVLSEPGAGTEVELVLPRGGD